MSNFVEIEVFSDEIKTDKILGICCLFIPLDSKEELVSDLLNMRCLNENSSKWYFEYDSCPVKNKCKLNWHKSNDCEIHNSRIRSSQASNSLKTISKKWLKYFINQNKLNKSIKFNILFIDLEKMDLSKFGESKIPENMYNKFFRTALNYGLKSFFNNSKVLVKNVYHDKGNMEKHSYFHYLNLHKLENEMNEVAQFENKEIVFVDSDHKNYSWNKDEHYNESQIIQFTDLILGNIAQCLFNLSNDNLKKEHASLLCPLVERLIRRPRNYNSSWNYVGKQSMSFFPRSKGKKYIDFQGNIKEFPKNEFHRNIKIKMPLYDSNQKSLFDFYPSFKKDGSL